MLSKDEAIKRIKDNMPKSRDPVLLILKGHLLIEEQVQAAVHSTLKHPAKLKDIRLTFHQYIGICEAIFGDAQPWDFVRRLNKVRNELAHQLDHEDIRKLVDSLIVAFDGDTTNLEHSPADRLRCLKSAIIMTCGMLHGMASQRLTIETSFQRRSAP